MQGFKRSLQSNTLASSFKEMKFVLSELFKLLKIEGVPEMNLAFKIPKEVTMTCAFILGTMMFFLVTVFFVYQTAEEFQYDPYYYLSGLTYSIIWGFLLFCYRAELVAALDGLMVGKMVLRLLLTLLCIFLLGLAIFFLFHLLNQMLAEYEVATLFFVCLFSIFILGRQIPGFQASPWAFEIGMCLLLAISAIFGLVYFSSELKDISEKIRLAIHTLVANLQSLVPFIAFTSFIALMQVLLLKNAVYGTESINLLSRPQLNQNFIFIFMLIISFRVIQHINTLFTSEIIENWLSNTGEESLGLGEIFEILCKIAVSLPKLITFGFITSIMDGIRVLLLLIEKISVAGGFLFSLSFSALLSGVSNRVLQYFNRLDTAEFLKTEEVDLDEVYDEKEPRSYFEIFTGRIPILVISLTYFQFYEMIPTTYTNYAFTAFIASLVFVELLRMITVTIYFNGIYSKSPHATIPSFRDKFEK